MPGEPVDYRCGYYGKVPNLGDFIKHNLPRSFLDPWDDWLQQSIAASREQLGDAWLDLFLTSPIYRFAITPGICGEQGWQGLLMPSVDRVGRYFPMTLCHQIRPGVNPLTLPEMSETWFDTAEQLIQRMLEDDFERSDFNQSLAELEAEHFDHSAPVPPTNGEFHPLALRWKLDSVSRLHGLMPDMLDEVLSQSCFAYSVWWTAGSEMVEPSIMISQGLPPIRGAGAFLDGNWRDWGWFDCNTAEQVTEE